MYSNLLSPILGFLPIGIRRAKSESSFTRCGLCVGTKNEGFHQRYEEGDLGESDFSCLGGVLENSFGSTMLQKVGILHTLVFFHLKGLISWEMWCKGPKALFG